MTEDSQDLKLRGDDALGLSMAPELYVLYRFL